MQRRRWLGVLCKRCNLYQRVYIDRSERAYRGKCIGCKREILVIIDRVRGVRARFFELD
jgi:hypothetical protein